MSEWTADALRVALEQCDSDALTLFLTHLQSLDSSARSQWLCDLVGDAALSVVVAHVTAHTCTDAFAHLLAELVLDDRLREQLVCWPGLFAALVELVSAHNQLPQQWPRHRHLISCLTFLVRSSGFLSILPSICSRLFATMAKLLRLHLQQCQSIEDGVAVDVMHVLCACTMGSHYPSCRDELMSPEHQFIASLKALLLQQSTSELIRIDQSFGTKFRFDLRGSTSCMRFCWGIFESGSVADVQCLLDEDIHSILVDILDCASRDPREWAPSVTILMTGLMNLASHQIGAAALKQTRLPLILDTIQFQSSNIECMKAAFITSFMFGRDEVYSQGRALLQRDDDLVPIIDEVLATVLSGLDTHPVIRRGIFCVKIVLLGIAALSVPDDNKHRLLSCGILPSVVRALQMFVENSAPIPNCGGGGSDAVAASAAIDILLQLSFGITDDQQLRSLFNDKFRIDQLLHAALEFNAPRVDLLPEGIAAARALLSRLSVREECNECQQGTRTHVMISYCWAARKDLVVSLVSNLRERGYDVWRDEDGSSLVSFMQGSTDDIMADAVENSYAVVVCVSPEYKQSGNCRMEAKYANDRFKKGKLKLIYVMMNQQYHTRSSPDSVDGWLAFMLGDALWYPCWDESVIDSTGQAISSILGCNARVAPLSRALSSPFSQSSPLSRVPTLSKSGSIATTALLSRPASVSRMISVAPVSNPVSSTASPLPNPAIPKTSTVATLISTPMDELTQAWTQLQTANNANASEQFTLLQSYCSEKGLVKSDDLAHLSESEVFQLVQWLKPIPARAFQSALEQYRQSDSLLCCWYLLHAAWQHTDGNAMLAKLVELGIRDRGMLRHLDSSQRQQLADLFKPVPRNMFLHHLSKLTL